MRTCCYTERFVHRDTFTTRPLHTEAFMQRNFYTQKIIHTDALHKDAFAPCSIDAQTLLHADAFTHRRLSGTNIFLHRNLGSVGRPGHHTRVQVHLYGFGRPHPTPPHFQRRTLTSFRHKHYSKKRVPPFPNNFREICMISPKIRKRNAGNAMNAITKHFRKPPGVSKTVSKGNSSKPCGAGRSGNVLQPYWFREANGVNHKTMVGQNLRLDEVKKFGLRETMRKCAKYGLCMCIHWGIGMHLLCCRWIAWSRWPPSVFCDLGGLRRMHST